MESDLFLVGLGLSEGFASSPILFLILRQNIEAELWRRFQVGRLRIASLLFGDDVVLMAPSVRDLQHSAMSSGLVLSGRWLACPLDMG